MQAAAIDASSTIARKSGAARQPCFAANASHLSRWREKTVESFAEGVCAIAAA
jgi:hypothetical protein